MQEISPIELKQRLEMASPPIILDVREPWEVERVALPQSQCIPMHELPSRLNELDSQRETVVLCHHGIRSRSVCVLLEQAHAFTRIFNLTGGIDAWARQIDPHIPTY